MRVLYLIERSLSREKRENFSHDDATSGKGKDATEAVKDNNDGE